MLTSAKFELRIGATFVLIASQKRGATERNEPRLSESYKLTECLFESAIKNFLNRRIRTDMSDGDRDWEEDFYILSKSLCPAVLTENFFMDNHSDLEYLQSRAGKQAVVDTHVEGIVEWLENLKS